MNIRPSQHYRSANTDADALTLAASTEWLSCPNSGMLEMQGTLDVTQYWPGGRSDADTTKVAVQVDQASCRFRPHASAQWRSTRFFEKARVRGYLTYSPADAEGRLTVRLEGIDAPELHFRAAALSRQEKAEANPSALKQYKAMNHAYRQRHGAGTSAALHAFMQRLGATQIPCRIWSQVDRPNNVFDAYGRFVGYIEILAGRTAINLNHWLLEQGLALPAFYSSMSVTDIQQFTAISNTARMATRGIWGDLSNTIDAFDFTLREPAAGAVEVLENDKGPFLFPKLFRRHCSWAVRREAGLTDISFQRYLNNQADYCFRTEAFIAQGAPAATPQRFADFVRSGRHVLFRPTELVFQELPSVLVNARGTPILHF